jgi:hypothetical protein
MLPNAKDQQISIVIPTVLRPTIFKTIESLFEQKDIDRVKVEVVINPLFVDKKILKKLGRIKGIIVRFHKGEYLTAEQSAFHAVATSTSDWIWILGDDDIAAPGSISHILDLVNNSDIDFWLLNCSLKFDQVPLKYYEVGPSRIQIARSFDVWQKLGFLTALTTLSCFLIRKRVLDLKLFEEFHKIQGVYSHSFSLLAMLQGSLVGITDRACVIRNEQGSEDIEKSLRRYSNSIGRDFDSLWIEGVIRLAEKLSHLTNIPLSTLLDFREIEIVKDPLSSYIIQSDISFLVSSTKEVSYKRLMLRSRISSSLKEKLSGGSPGLILKGPIRISL